MYLKANGSNYSCLILTAIFLCMTTASVAQTQRTPSNPKKPTTNTRTNTEYPNISFIKKRVKVQSIQDKSWFEVTQENQQLPERGKIIVPAESFAEIQFDSTTTVKLNEKTGLAYSHKRVTDTFGKTNVNLYYGSLKSKIKRSMPDQESDQDNFEVKTPVATAGVRGTEFTVSHERRKISEVSVNSGRVRYQTPNAHKTVPSNKYIQARLKNYRTPNTPSELFGLSQFSSLFNLKPVPQHIKLIWKHWGFLQKIRGLSKKAENLREYIKKESGGKPLDEVASWVEDDEGEAGELADQARDVLGVFSGEKKVSSALKENVESYKEISNRVDSLKKRFKAVQNQYSSFRKRLEDRRGNFVEKRKKLLVFKGSRRKQ